MTVNEIEVMANIEPSHEAYELLSEHCGLCNGTCENRLEHVWRIEVALLRDRIDELETQLLLAESTT